MKYCPKCKTTKNKSEFGKAKDRPDGLRGWCKECNKLASYKWKKKNPDKYKAKQHRFYEKHKDEILKVSRIRVREWYKNNTDKALEYGKIWAANNRDKINQYNKEWKERNADIVHLSNKEYRVNNKDRRNEYNRQWRADNIEKARELGREHAANRLKIPKWKLSSNISRQIRLSLTNKNGNHWESLVDFTLDQLKEHLESQFDENMNWENYGSYWHIDHIVPIAAFNFEEFSDIDFKRCWSLNNLRPLEKYENIKKSDKVDIPFQPSLAIAV